MTYEQLIQLFEQQLNEGILKANTVFAHVDNIQFFYEVFLEQDLRQPLSECPYPNYGLQTVEEFFDSFYIEQCMQASKTDLKQYLASIKKYAKMLYNLKFIDAGVLAELNELIKEKKESWLDVFSHESQLLMLDDLYDDMFYDGGLDEMIDNEIAEMIDTFQPLRQIMDMHDGSIDVEEAFDCVHTQYEANIKTFELSLVKKVYQEIYSFACNYQPWKYITNSDLFAIEHPELSERYYIGVLGDGGLEYGINLYTGDENVKYLKNMIENVFEFEDEASYNFSMFMIALDQQADVWPVDRILCEKSGVKFKSTKRYPAIRKMSMGQPVVGIDQDDLKELAILLPLVNQMLRHMIGNQQGIGHEGLSEYVLRSYGSDGSYMDQVMLVDALLNTKDERPLVVEDLLVAQVKKLPKKNNVILEMDAFFVKYFYKIEDQLIYPLLLVCAGFPDDDLYRAESFFYADASQYAQAIGTYCLRLFQSLGYRPQGIKIRKSIHFKILEAICNRMDIRIEWIRHYSLIADLKDIGRELFV